MQTETVIELFNESAERGLLCALMQNPYALGEITIEREELSSSSWLFRRISVAQA